MNLHQDEKYYPAKQDEVEYSLTGDSNNTTTVHTNNIAAEINSMKLSMDAQIADEVIADLMNEETIEHEAAKQGKIVKLKHAFHSMRNSLKNLALSH
jgi:CTP-dependent riboflavin kinase